MPQMEYWKMFSAPAKKAVPQTDACVEKQICSAQVSVDAVHAKIVWPAVEMELKVIAVITVLTHQTQMKATLMINILL